MTATRLAVVPGRRNVPSEMALPRTCSFDCSGSNSAACWPRLDVGYPSWSQLISELRDQVAPELLAFPDGDLTSRASLIRISGG